MLGTVLVSAALLGGGWVLGAAPLLASAAASDAAVGTAHQRTAQLQVQLQTLAEKAQDIQSLKLKADAASAAVPSGLNARAFIDRLNGIAAQDGLTVKSITPGAAQPYTLPASAAAAAAAAAAASAPAAATPTPAPTATAGAATAGAAAAPVAVPVKPQAATDPRVTGANLVAIPMSVSVKGSNSNVLDFLKDVQTDSRLFLVSGYNSSVDASTKDVTAMLTGYIYALKS